MCCKGLNGVCVWPTQPSCRCITSIPLQLPAQVSHVKLHCPVAVITRFFAKIHFLNTAAAQTDNTIHQNHEVLVSFTKHYVLEEWFSISSSVICVSVNDHQQDATILAYLFTPNQRYMFRGCLRPSSGALDCIYNFWYCPPILLPAGVMDEMEQLFHLIHVNTVKCSWWWAKTSSETCRAD